MKRQSPDTSDPRRIILFLALAALLTSSATWAQTVTVGQALARAGDTVQVPISVQHTTATAGLLLRLDYDPAVLEAPSAEPGESIGASQTVDAHSPEPGRVNLFIASLTNIDSFASAEGTVAYLTFYVKTNPAADYSDLTLASVSSGLSPSTMLDSSGNNIAHTVKEGRVFLPEAAGTTNWMLY